MIRGSLSARIAGRTREQIVAQCIIICGNTWGNTPMCVRLLVVEKDSFRSRGSLRTSSRNIQIRLIQKLILSHAPAVIQQPVKGTWSFMLRANTAMAGSRKLPVRVLVPVRNAKKRSHRRPLITIMPYAVSNRRRMLAHTSRRLSRPKPRIP
jgi:hypothetical protein